MLLTQRRSVHDPQTDCGCSFWRSHTPPAWAGGAHPRGPRGPARKNAQVAHIPPWVNGNSGGKRLLAAFCAIWKKWLYFWENYTQIGNQLRICNYSRLRTMVSRHREGLRPDVTGTACTACPSTPWKETGHRPRRAAPDGGTVCIDVGELPKTSRSEGRSASGSIPPHKNKTY